MVALLLFSQQSVHDLARVQQVANRSDQRGAIGAGLTFRGWIGAVQIGPGSRKQRPGSIRQLQAQIVAAAALKMSENAQRLSLHRMAGAQNRYRSWKVAEVGSVWWVPSTTSRTNR